MTVNLSNINTEEVQNAMKTFKHPELFDYCVIDNFFKYDVANQLSGEIPDFESPFWHEYNNAIELKKTCNDWNKFPQLTYSAFAFLNSEIFINYIQEHSGIKPLYPDPGLNGGGWHIHSNGGKLNPHLDYSIHPKLKQERKLNIIIYLEKGWQSEWGGHLGLYADTAVGKPKKLEIEIEPKFNRAVLFDTTQNSWHGLSRVVTTPDGYCRKSMAAYYLTTPDQKASERGKALFAPTDDQSDDESIAELIKLRSDPSAFNKVYRKNEK